MNVSQLLNAVSDYDRHIVGIESGSQGLPESVSSKHVGKITHDHRRVDAESVFVAIKGNHVDSHSFIEDARNFGAALIIGQSGNKFEREPDLVVGSTRAIIGPLASAFHGFPSAKMRLVGITGTNGKTTVSYLYSAIIQEIGRHCFIMGTTGILVDGEKEAESQTTPDPLVMQQYFSDFLTDGIKDGAIEVSSHALHQFRVLGTYFAAVAFTNFSQDHLDYHESMEEYFEAKMALFTTIYAHDAVVNIDNEYGDEVCKLATSNGQNVIRVSTKDSKAEIYIETISASLSESKLVAHITSGDDNVNKIEFTTTLIGDFNYENIAVALGLAKATKCDMQIAVNALCQPESVPGRLQRPQIQSDIAVFVDYAHTPDALERVLAMMKPLAKRLIVVFGCGGERDYAKRPIMGMVASKLADQVIITNDNPRSEDPMSIASDIKKGTTGEVLTELDRRAAIKTALSLAQVGDVVIIAGKGHEQEQIFADRVEEFSDIKVLEEIINSMEVN